MPITVKTTAIVVFVFITVSNFLTGCSSGTSMARVVGGLGSPFGPSREYTADYQRFKKQYAQLANNDMSRASQLRHFSDAYLRVRSEYVHVLNDKLLIETDSPYLAPVPLRGKKNEPSFLKHTLDKLSHLKKTEIHKMEKITSENFNLLFKLK